MQDKIYTSIIELSWHCR